MKKTVILILVLAFTMAFSNVVLSECITVQDGTLQTTDGRTITPGYDMWGYNYGAHIFNGGYCDAYRDAAWCQAYKDEELIMKWNDSWLSNKDCDDDALLDRHFGNASYIGSGAWLTNHQSGKVEVNGKMRKWTYFVKIVAAPEDAYSENGFWYTSDGIELGPVIWGAFAIVQEVSNDPSAGVNGIQYKSPVDPGLGNL